MKDLFTTGGHVGRKKRLALAVGAWLLAGTFSVTPSATAHPILDAAGAAKEYTGTITALESTARDENQTAPPQDKLAAGTTATHTSHLTIENGGVNTPPNMDVAAALAAGAAAEQTAATQESEEEEA